MSVQDPVVFPEVPEFEDIDPKPVDEFYRKVDWNKIEGAENLSELDKKLIELSVQPTREERRQLRRQKEDAPSALGAAFDQGINRVGLATGEVGEFLGQALDNETLLELSRAQIEEETEQIEAMQDFRTSREDIGFGSLDEIGSGISYYSEAFAETLPLLATGIAATIAGTAAAPALGITGVGAVALGATAGAASQVPYFFGSNITRQKDVGRRGDSIDYSDAFLASLGQAGVSQLTNLVALKAFNVLGPKAGSNLFQGIGKGGEGLFIRPKSRLKSAGAGAAATSFVEGSAEAVQTVLEQMQAGLDIYAPEQVDETLKALIDGAVLGGVLGGATGAAGVDTISMARKQEEASLVRNKLENLDNKAAKELEALPKDAPDWKAEQIIREVRAETFFDDGRNIL